MQKKPFDKNLTFQDGTLNKLQKINTNINIIMPLWKEHSNGERMKAFPQGRTLCTTLQQSTEILRAIRWEKEIKGPQIEKEGNVSSFPHDNVS